MDCKSFDDWLKWVLGFPRILLEAAACGCALISSNQPVMHEIVKPGKTGWLLDDPGVDEIELVFSKAAVNIDQTRSMGMAAAALAATLPIDDKSIAEKILEIYSLQSSLRAPDSTE